MYRIGVDLGGTNIVSAVVDENNKIIARAKEKTNSPRPAEEIFDDIAKTIHDAVYSAGLTMKDIESIGVGTPGSVNKEKGIIEFANNLGFDNVPAYRNLCKASAWTVLNPSSRKSKYGTVTIIQKVIYNYLYRRKNKCTESVLTSAVQISYQP